MADTAAADARIRARLLRASDNRLAAEGAGWTLVMAVAAMAAVANLWDLLTGSWPAAVWLVGLLWWVRRGRVGLARCAWALRQRREAPRV